MSVRITAIIFSFLLLQACAKDNSHTEGQLSFGISGCEETVSRLRAGSGPFVQIMTGGGTSVQTRTGESTTAGGYTLPQVGESELDKFIVNAGTSSDDASIIAAETYGAIRGSIYTVPVGSYVASAYNCTEEAAHPEGGFGCVRYYGSTQFDVVAGQRADVTIRCSVTNSMVSVVLDESFLRAFKATATQVTLATDADRTVRPLVFDNTKFSETPASCAFYPANTPIYVTVKSQLYSLDGNGEVKEYEFKGSITDDGAAIRTAAATWHKIRISANSAGMPEGITIKVGEEQETLQNGISINSYNGGSLKEDL